MVIGLEVHCELATATKLFCSCPNRFGAEPNTNICPVCLGLPGSLPVFNRQAVELAMRIGTALGSDIRPSNFHRKNYFYPDMPKDFQVSQYDKPINVGGRLDLPGGRRIRLVRAHLEEDTGKTTHVGTSGRIHGADFALIDYNRAGVPLVEIVSEPDLRSGEEAKAYINELRLILAAVEASDARMEEGSLRVDANVSVRRPGEPLGTRAEIKNLNSVRSLGRAIDYEAARQSARLEMGERIIQETRHWDDSAGVTISLRSKEEAEDYRYFPEPDLVPLDPDEAWRRRVTEYLPLLPAQRRARLADAAGVEVTEAQVAALVTAGLDDFVADVIGLGTPGPLALTRVANQLPAIAVGSHRPGPALAANDVAAVLTLESSGRLTPSQAKVILSDMVAAGGGDPEALASARGFAAVAADALAEALEAVLAANPGEWGRYLEGEVKLTGFLVGRVMAATGGSADGRAVTALLRQRAGV
ncbi:MAG: Asp-tRNA(Asn)/Glu-tRNA(Gln) amidotransferase subunit GatB [Acidimicrobiales bacterium]